MLEFCHFEAREFVAHCFSVPNPLHTVQHHSKRTSHSKHCRHARSNTIRDTLTEVRPISPCPQVKHAEAVLASAQEAAAQEQQGVAAENADKADTTPRNPT